MHDKEVFFMKKALFLLGPQAPRSWIVWLTQWKHFDNFILAIIVANSLTLAMYDYSDREAKTVYN